MKYGTPWPVLYLMSIIPAPVVAQVVNGSFETAAGDPDPVSGWMSPMCPELVIDPSADTPGGTGNWSLRVVAEHWSQSFCYYTFDQYQSATWLTPGPWTLSYWSKGHGGTGPPATVKVAYLFDGSAPSLTSQWGEGNATTQWNYAQEDFNIGPSFPWMDSLIVLIAGGAADEGPLHSYFDDIRITGITTDVSSYQADSKPAFRPNPVSDEMWIDLEAMPLAIEASDALGRSIPIATAYFSQHTLVLDVRSFPPGVVYIKFRMVDGSRHIRFMKV